MQPEYRNLLRPERAGVLEGCADADKQGVLLWSVAVHVVRRQAQRLQVRERLSGREALRADLLPARLQVLAEGVRFRHVWGHALCGGTDLLPRHPAHAASALLRPRHPLLHAGEGCRPEASDRRPRLVSEPCPEARPYARSERLRVRGAPINPAHSQHVLRREPQARLRRPRPLLRDVQQKPPEMRYAVPSTTESHLQESLRIRTATPGLYVRGGCLLRRGLVPGRNQRIRRGAEEGLQLLLAET